MTDPMRPTGPTWTPCGAKTRSGRPCPNPPIKGATRCRQHGGASPASLAKAKERLLEANVAGELTKRGWEPVTDPLPAYADLVGEVWAWKELCREQVSKLQRWDYTDLKAAGDAKALVVVYERALDRARGALVDMMRLGIDAQALRLAKARPSREQAEQFAAILDALDLTAEQSAKLPALLTRLIGDDQ